MSESEATADRIRGQCLCGAVEFEVDRHIHSDAKPDRYDFADDRPRVTEAELMKELGL